MPALNANDAPNRAPAPRTAMWFAAAMLLVIAAGFGLRHGSDVLDQPNVRDERLMKVPIDNILDKGWSIDTAINYQEVKGPAFFWAYALGAEVLGSDINDLRLITVLFFIGSALPLLLILLRCGIRGPTLLVGALLYVLLPYNTLVGQILMSEASFVFFGMWLMWAFIWGFGNSSKDEKRLWGPVLFAVLLSVLLHHRPHAVAFAGAAALVAWERDGLRSWPWWLACVLAGLSRVPLWLHWGGLVTSDYQDLFTLGFRVQPATYLFAASLPWTWIFLWRGVFGPANRYRRWFVAAGGVVGLLLGLVFLPDLQLMASYVHPGMDNQLMQQQMYAGIVKTSLRIIFADGWMHTAALIALATAGGSAIGAMVACTWQHTVTSQRGVTARLFAWTLLVGIGLFMMTGGPVYDRYLQVWTILLPAIWLWSAPRWLLGIHILLLAGIGGYLATQWLM